MMTTLSGRYSFAALIAAFILAGCASPQSTLPNLMPQAAQHKPPPSGASYLYISTDEPKIELYSYPKGHKIADIPVSGQTLGACAATSGEVFITAVSGSDFSGLIYEFAAGSKTPWHILTETESAVDCSYDAKAGNLAVVNRGHGQYKSGSVAIFTNAQGTPTLYAAPSYFANITGCAYDMAGNLFVAGIAEYESGSSFMLAELPKGASTFTQITLDQAIGQTGSSYSVQWNGTNLAVTDRTRRGQGPTTIYSVAISGSAGSVERSTELKTHSNKNFISSPYTWIEGNKVLAPSKAGVSMWAFPKGGKGKAILKSGGAFAEVVGSTS